MKKFSRNKATGKRGVAFVEEVVFGAGSIFREVPEDTDLGIDGYIEFIDNEISMGTMLGVQIKSGPSFLVQFSDAKYFVVKASKKDFHYWNIQPIPVALVVYDPETKLSGWRDLTGFIRDHPECLTQETTSLKIHSTGSPFTIETFQNKFRPTFTKYRYEADLFSYADLVASDDPSDKFRGFLGLLNHPSSKFSKITCYLLINHLFDENPGIREMASDSLSRYLPHPEVGFRSPRTISEYIVSSIEKFGKREIAQLLETGWLDEMNLMQRGSLGQSIGVIITNIPEHEMYLCDIAIDEHESREARWAAIALAAEFYIQRTIYCIAKNFQGVEWGDVLEELAQWLVQEYENYEFEERRFQEIIDNQDYDNDDLAYIINGAGPVFLGKYEDLIAEVEIKTSNYVVRNEARQVINKIIMQWKNPANKSVWRLF